MGGEVAAPSSPQLSFGCGGFVRSVGGGYGKGGSFLSGPHSSNTLFSSLQNREGKVDCRVMWGGFVFLGAVGAFW